jgi:hypothetical protein
MTYAVHLTADSVPTLARWQVWPTRSEAEAELADALTRSTATDEVASLLTYYGATLAGFCRLVGVTVPTVSRWGWVVAEVAE